MENDNLVSLSAVQIREISPVVLSKDEMKWFEIFKRYCQKTNKRYVVTWCLKFELKISTSKINYHLSKLVNKGLLKKLTNCYCTKFYDANAMSTLLILIPINYYLLILLTIDNP